MLTFIKLFVDYLDAIEPLGDAERGRLFTSLLEYARDGEAPQLCGNERFLFPMMRAQIDRDNKALEELVEIRSQAGKMGGRPKKQTKAKKANGFCESKKSYDKDNDKDNDNDKDKDIHPLPPQGADARQNETQTPKGESLTVETAQGAAKEAVAHSTTPEAFDVFWQAYPKKVGKLAAKKAFDKANVPVETLLDALERQKCGEQWQKNNGQFIPNPATWLNQGRWEDEQPIHAQKGGGQGLRQASYDLSAFEELALFGGEKP